MTSVFSYLIESSILMTLFYVLYLLLLRNERSFTFNRFYLLICTVLAVVIPLLSFEFLQTGGDRLSKPMSTLYEWQSNGIARITEPNTSSINVLAVILVIAYLGGVLYMLFRLSFAIRRVWVLIKKHPVTVIDNTPVVQLDDQLPPFSFFKFAFINQSILNTSSFDQIMAHEKVHIEQKHSYDIIFIELLACFFWFNPVMWMISKSIKALHEYIADHGIMSFGFSSIEYQSLLLEQLMSGQSNKLMPHFNLSFIKKRITMMNTKKSKALKNLKVGAVSFIALLITIIALNYCSFPNDSIKDHWFNGYLVTLDSKSISFESGIDYSLIASKNFKGEMTVHYKDKNPTPKTQLEFTLVGKDGDSFVARASVKVEEIKDWSQNISLKSLLEKSQRGDMLNVSIKGLYEKGSYLNIPIN